MYRIVLAGMLVFAVLVMVSSGVPSSEARGVKQGTCRCGYGCKCIDCDCREAKPAKEEQQSRLHLFKGRIRDRLINRRQARAYGVA